MPDFVSIDSVKPASYNPRRIDEREFSKLCDSLRELGVIVPVIVNPKNHVLVAGHQRTKAAKAVGITELPCFYASNVSPSDEVLFNQIHNGTDFDKGVVGLMEPFEESGWQECQPEANKCDCDKAVIVGEVVKLIQRYGNVLSCVASMGGDVFSSAAYATACRKLNIPANVYVIEPEKELYARKAFKASYGVFSYEHLEKNTWVQGLAQMHRHREKTNAKGTKTKPRSKKSRLYEGLVLPYVTKDMRILDFGCGKGYYIDLLIKDGYDALGVEWYNNNGSQINVTKARKQAEAALADIEANGLFDVVVCDSVLNSVDSVKAEESVVATCNALLKPGGSLFISCRRVEQIHKRIRQKSASQAADYSYFAYLDENNFTATLRKGNFYYQHFHSLEQIEGIRKRHGFEHGKDVNLGTGWYRQWIKVTDSETWREGVAFEFDLPYPGGSYGYAERAVKAIEDARRSSANGRTASSGKSDIPFSGR